MQGVELQFGCQDFEQLEPALVSANAGMHVSIASWPYISTIYPIAVTSRFNAKQKKLDEMDATVNSIVSHIPKRRPSRGGSRRNFAELSQFE